MGHIARKVGIVMLTLIGLIEGKIRNDEQRVTCIKYLSEWIAEHVNDRRKMKKKKKIFFSSPMEGKYRSPFNFLQHIF